jgi:hypothetical protein
MLGSSTFRYVRHFLRISTEREPALVLSSLMGLVGMYQSPLSLSLFVVSRTHRLFGLLLMNQAVDLYC